MVAPNEIKANSTTTVVDDVITASSSDTFPLPPSLPLVSESCAVPLGNNELEIKTKKKTKRKTASTIPGGEKKKEKKQKVLTTPVVDDVITTSSSDTIPLPPPLPLISENYAVHLEPSALEIKTKKKTKRKTTSPLPGGEKKQKKEKKQKTASSILPPNYAVPVGKALTTVDDTSSPLDHETKVCSRCKEVKSKTTVDFRTSVDRCGGYRAQCKACEKEIKTINKVAKQSAPPPPLFWKRIKV
jgi:translation initiation factor 1 (eIF-1/SUI1)